MITYAVECDNCQRVEFLTFHSSLYGNIYYDARHLTVNEWWKRFKEKERWTLTGGYHLCPMCTVEFKGYKKDYDGWLDEAKQIRRDSIKRRER